jgi:predicted nucleic acid-binding protein
VRLLLDTCALSELRNPAGSAALKSFIDPIPAASLFLSVITIGEVVRGVALLADGRKKQSLSVWVAGLSRQFAGQVLPVDHETAELWGEMSAAGQKAGAMIPAPDGLIAATALRHGLHVVTRDTRHFETAGAMVVNPW